MKEIHHTDIIQITHRELYTYIYDKYFTISNPETKNTDGFENFDVAPSITHLHLPSESEQFSTIFTTDSTKDMSDLRFLHAPWNSDYQFLQVTLLLDWHIWKQDDNFYRSYGSFKYFMIAPGQTKVAKQFLLIRNGTICGHLLDHGTLTPSVAPNLSDSTVSKHLTDSYRRCKN